MIWGSFLLYLLVGGCQITIPNFHVIICPVDYLDEDNELFDVSVDYILKRIFHDHSIVDDVNDQALALDVWKLSGYCPKDSLHYLAGLIIEPFGCKKAGVVVLEDIHEDNLVD